MCTRSLFRCPSKSQPFTDLFDGGGGEWKQVDFFVAHFFAQECLRKPHSGCQSFKIKNRCQPLSDIEFVLFIFLMAQGRLLGWGRNVYQSPWGVPAEPYLEDWKSEHVVIQIYQLQSYFPLTLSLQNVGNQWSGRQISANIFCDDSIVYGIVWNVICRYVIPIILNFS